jgi:F0F1-type ATP synthase delta subunit
MLSATQKASSRKYAAAFLNVHEGTLTPSDIDAILQAAQFLADHRRAVFLLKVPIIPEQVKREGLQDFCDRFGVPRIVMDLLTLLMDHKRAHLLGAVLKDIVKEYNRRHDKVTIMVTSANPLDSVQKKQLEDFAERIFPGIKTYEYELDNTLIAGVRLQSDTLLWEYSIDNYLRNCARADVW